MRSYPIKISHLIDNQLLKSVAESKKFCYKFIISDLPLTFDGKFHSWFHK